MKIFVKFFGVLLGLLCTAYGLFAVVGGMSAPGPCGVSCEFNNALVRLLGQTGQSVIYGGFWVISGLVFVWFIIYRVGKGKGR